MSELNNIIKGLNKKFKTGNIQVGVEFQDIEKVPFSSCRLNYMTYGGIPIGRLAEFSGADGSGKTTTALDIAAQCQKKYPDKKVFFCDIESTFDSAWATKLGVKG
jgi:RecA/RadA recombinase